MTLATLCGIHTTVTQFDDTRTMELSSLAEMLAAIGQKPRLKIVALLAREQSGLAAGQIALRLGIGKSTLSTQLRILLKAGILDSDRQGRQIIYSFNRPRISQSLSELLATLNAGPASHTGHATLKKLS